MNSSRRFRINIPSIVHEAIDGEVVIINLENGNYYSLEGVGAEVWGSIDRGGSVGEIVGELDSHYRATHAQMESAVEQFLADLQADDLIVTADSGAGKSDRAMLTQGDGRKLDFQPPVLNRYTDMQDLLLLDPIHDVDETGWPRVPPEPTDN